MSSFFWKPIALTVGLMVLLYSMALNFSQVGWGYPAYHHGRFYGGSFFYWGGPSYYGHPSTRSGSLSGPSHHAGGFHGGK